MIKKQCETRHLCDEHGYRRPGVHWVFSLAVTPEDVLQVNMSSSDRVYVCVVPTFALSLPAIKAISLDFMCLILPY